MIREESPASQPPIEDEELLAQPKILFPENVGKGGSTDGDISATMNVSTAELLTQPPTSTNVEKERVVEVIENIRTITKDAKGPQDNQQTEREGHKANKELAKSGEPTRENNIRQVGHMDGVEYTGKPVTSANEIISTQKPVPELPAMGANTRQPSLHVISPPISEVTPSAVVPSSSAPFITQNEPSSSQDRRSAPSNVVVATQDQSRIKTVQSESRQSLESQVSSSREPSAIPQLHSSLPERQSPLESSNLFQISPSKATSIVPIPPSAQVQVKQTPFPAQTLNSNPEIAPTGVTTHVSATAPTTNSSPLKRSIEPIQRKHKREKHVGPIVPKFGRSERRLKINLEALLMEDFKKFQETQKEKEQATNESDAPVATREDTVMQDVIEVRSESEKPDVVANVDTEMKDALKPEREIEESSRNAEIVVQTPQVQPLAGTQDDSQTFVPAQSRWGRLANHWRRLSRFTTK